MVAIVSAINGFQLRIPTYTGSFNSSASNSPCRKREGCQRRPPDQPVAMLHFLNHFRWDGPAAGNLVQKFRDFIHRIGTAMSQQQNRISFSCRQLQPPSNLGRIFLHKLRQRLDVLHRRLRQNAMSQIKNMPRPSAGAPQNLLPRSPLFPSSRQKAAPDPDFPAPLRTRLPSTRIQRNPPVQADHFGASFLHRRQKRGAVRAEINDRTSVFCNDFTSSVVRGST